MDLRKQIIKLFLSAGIALQSGCSMPRPLSPQESFDDVNHKLDIFLRTAQTLRARETACLTEAPTNAGCYGVLLYDENTVANEVREFRQYRQRMPQDINAKGWRDAARLDTLLADIRADLRRFKDAALSNLSAAPTSPPPVRSQVAPTPRRLPPEAYGPPPDVPSAPPPRGSCNGPTSLFPPGTNVPNSAACPSP